MTTWYYYDNGQKKGPFTSDQLKELVKQGVVTRETILENTAGQTGPARKVKGLFPKAAQPSPPQPAEPNPFVLAPPESDNPFTVAKPPKSAVPPVTQTVPPSASVSDEDEDRISLWVPIVGVLVVLVVCVIGWWVIFGLPDKEKPVPTPFPDPNIVAQNVGVTTPDDNSDFFDGEPPVDKPEEDDLFSDIPLVTVVPTPVVQPVDTSNESATANLTPILPNDNDVYYFNTTLVGDMWNYFYVDGNNTAWEIELSKTKCMENVRSIHVLGSGDRTVFFITTNNELWAMGYNEHGQVGDDTGLNQAKPVFIMSDVANLYFGPRQMDTRSGADGYAICALKTDKSRWVWGKVNLSGENIFAPKKVDNYFNHNQQLLADHISMKNDNPEIYSEVYTSVPLPDDIEVILGGKENIMTSLEFERFEGMFKTKNPTKSRYYAVTKDGTLWGWGFNEGRLGDGTRADRAKPVKIAENVKRLLPKYFVTQSNDWYEYSYQFGTDERYKPIIAFKNPLYIYSNDVWFTPDGKLVCLRSRSDVSVIIDNIKLPSIVRASNGQVIVPPTGTDRTP